MKNKRPKSIYYDEGLSFNSLLIRIIFLATFLFWIIWQVNSILDAFK
jgi:hypothetical protein